MLKFHYLRDFVAIADARSLRGAARALGQGQPAMTRSVRELESLLGTPLLQRHARGVVLTPAGERFLVRARCVLQDLQRGVDEIKQLEGDPAGTVTVAFSSAPILAQLPQAYVEFRRRYPQVSLHLVEAAFPAAQPMMVDGRLDLYVGPRPENPVAPTFRVETLYTNRRMVFARSSHPLQGARRLAELAAADWIYSGLRERAEEDLEDLFRAHRIALPASRSRIDSLLGVLTLLIHSDALALLPQQWAEFQAFATNIRPIRIKESLAAPDIVMIQRAALPLTPAAERFATLLQRAALPSSPKRPRATASQ